MTVHTIDLRRAKSAGSDILEYKRSSIQSSQKRLQARYALMPVISLDRFETTAVIDWVDVKFDILANTQARWISDFLKIRTGDAVYIREIESVDFAQYVARFQQPELTRVIDALEAIDQRFELVAGATITGIEVSIDFTPRVVCSGARSRMVAVLARHLLPDRDVLSIKGNRPRFVWGDGERERTHILGDPDKGLANYANLFTTGDRAPYVDATVYFGSEKSGCLWRVMDKVVDQQNRQTGARKVLSENEKRARVEVSLGVAEIRRLGITSLEHLRTFKFSKLQKEFFAFYLPTFTANDAVPCPRQRAVKEVRSRERILKFIKTGVVGLQAMDEAWTTRRSTKHTDLARLLRSRGQPVSRFRAGKGKHGTLLAYEELSKKVEFALRHLTEKTGRS